MTCTDSCKKSKEKLKGKFTVEMLQAQMHLVDIENALSFFDGITKKETSLVLSLYFIYFTHPWEESFLFSDDETV